MSIDKQPGEVLLERHELQAGDRLFGREHEDWGTLPDFGGHVVEPDLKHASMWSYKLKTNIEDRYPIDNFTGKGRYRVVRPGATIDTRRKGTDDGWNSNCPKCGCRTYVGLINIEHESPGCRS